MSARSRARFTALNQPVLWLATLWHAVMGLALILAPQTTEHVTGSLVNGIFHDPNVAGLMFLLSSITAALALSAVRPSFGTFWALIPQQVLVTTSAAAAVYFAAQGHYASGHVLPPLFILVDQFPKVLLAFLHPLGMYKMHEPIFPEMT